MKYTLEERDVLLNAYKQGDVGMSIYKLLEASKKLSENETAFEGLQIGDLWKFEFRVTKLRSEY